MNARKLYTLVLSVALMLALSACKITMGSNGCGNIACTNPPTQTSITLP